MNENEAAGAVYTVSATDQDSGQFTKRKVYCSHAEPVFVFFEISLALYNFINFYTFHWVLKAFSVSVIASMHYAFSAEPVSLIRKRFYPTEKQQRQRLTGNLAPKRKQPEAKFHLHGNCLTWQRDTIIGL